MNLLPKLRGAAAVAMTVTLVAACTSVPATLQPGAGQRALATVAAAGVQIYECRAGTAGAPAGWAFVAPDARLFDEQGHDIGGHGAGPYWLAHDGSRVEGTVRSRADAPVAGAIPWLLLATRSTGVAGGRFAAVTHIQRIHTAGGQAPAHGCDTRALGRQVRVPYRADYRLFVPA